MPQRRKICSSLWLKTLGILAAFIMILDFSILHNERILPGVSVAGVDLSYCTVNDAEKILETLISRAVSRQISLEDDDQRWSYQASQLGLAGDARLSAESAWQVGRKGFFWHRWRERWQAAVRGIPVDISWQLDPRISRGILMSIAGRVSLPAVDAGFQVTRDHQLLMIPAAEGRMLDMEKTGRLLDEALSDPKRCRVQLFLAPVPPRFSTEEVEKWQITGVISSYATDFNPAQSERSLNIKIATGALDGQIIAGGGTFSFNGAVGPRTEEKGYQKALVIENNQFTPGIGGGVCQVVSTVYNAFLLAGFSVLERHPHSLPVSYVPPGLDATVSESWADLKMQNGFATPVLLHTEYRSGRISIFVFGPEADAPRLRFSSRVIRMIQPEVERIEDRTLPPGVQLMEQEGRQGMEVEVTRETLGRGEADQWQVVERIVFSRNRYRPVNSRIRSAPL